MPAGGALRAVAGGTKVERECPPCTPPAERAIQEYARACGASERPVGMTTPTGCLQVLTATLMRLARKGDVDGFRTYVRSDAFLAAFNGLDPGRRQSVMRSHARAEALCESK